MGSADWVAARAAERAAEDARSAADCAERGFPVEVDGVRVNVVESPQLSAADPRTAVDEDGRALVLDTTSDGVVWVPQEG